MHTVKRHFEALSQSLSLATSLPRLLLSAHINGPTTVATFWSTLRWSKCERAVRYRCAKGMAIVKR